MTDPRALVQRLWDFCDVLRDDGLSYGDYLEPRRPRRHQRLRGVTTGCPTATTWSSSPTCCS